MAPDPEWPLQSQPTPLLLQVLKWTPSSSPACSRFRPQFCLLNQSLCSAALLALHPQIIHCRRLPLPQLIPHLAAQRQLHGRSSPPPLLALCQPHPCSLFHKCSERVTCSVSWVAVSSPWVHTICCPSSGELGEMGVSLLVRWLLEGSRQVGQSPGPSSMPADHLTWSIAWPPEGPSVLSLCSRSLLWFHGCRTETITASLRGGRENGDVCVLSHSVTSDSVTA